MILLKKKVTFSVENEQYFVTLENGKKFNLSEILANFDATQLHLKKNYSNAYVDYLKNHSEQKPKKDPDFASFGEDDWPTPEYFDKRDEAKELQNLTYGEKCAINIYTQAYFSTMNDMLRGQQAISPESETFQEEMSEVLLHNMFAASGLKKVDNTVVKNAFRVVKNLPPEVLKQKIDSIQNEVEVFTERGFISTSKDRPIDNLSLGTSNENPLFIASQKKTKNKKDGAVYTVFGNVAGKNIAALSANAKEREVLMPPTTQIKYKHVRTDDGDTYLYGEVVRTPGITSERTIPGVAHELTATELTLEKRLKKGAIEEANTQEIEDLIKKVQHLKKDYKKQEWKFHTDSARKRQISKLMRLANTLEDDSKMPPKEKMIQITEALLNVQKEIHMKQGKRSRVLSHFSSKSRLDKTITESLDVLTQKNKEIYNVHQSAQNLFEYDNPIFDERMKPIIEHVHAKLSNPYQDTATINTGEHQYVHPDTNQIVNRPNHGTPHTLRGAVMVPVVVEYYKKHANSHPYKKEFDKMDINDIKRMQVAMLFSTVGRQCEDNDKYTEYRNNSALAFKEYCKEHCKDLFNDKQITEYTEYLKDYTDPGKTTKHPKAEIMRMCHSLDVLRYEPVEAKFNGYCKNELNYKLGERPAEALIAYSRQCLLATGNRIRTGEREGHGKPYKPDLFTECSLDPTKTLGKLRKVEPPKDLSKPKLNIM
jgi:hypothetical protein